MPIKAAPSVPESNIAGLVCRSCWRLVAANGEHWFSECDDPTVHPGIIEAALDDESHLDLTLTPSTVLGAVRFEFIRRTMKYWPEAQGFNSMQVGAAVGERIEKALLKRGFERQVAAEGTLFGEHFRSGGSDLVLFSADRKQMHMIVSNKFGNEGTLYYARGRGVVAGNEDAAQVNMEAMLHAQMGREGAMDAEMTVWRGTVASAVVTTGNKKKNEVVGNFRDEWVRQRAPRMTEEEIGALRPFGAGASVVQNVAWLAEGFKRVRGGEDARTILKTLGVIEGGALACETRFNDAACRAYCGGARTCLFHAGRSLRDKRIVEVRIPLYEEKR